VFELYCCVTPKSIADIDAMSDGGACIPGEKKTGAFENPLSTDEDPD
jgi:hypothetical protein